MRLPAELVASLRPAFEGRSVCVTGGAGFIGGHTVDALLSLGANVTVIDDLSNSSPAHLMEHMEFEPQRLRFVHASILDPAALRHAVADAELVLHLAAVGSVPRSIEEPARTFAVNADGTVCVVQACRRVGVRRVVFASSSSVYGSGAAAGSNSPRQGPPAQPEARTESMALAPMSPYAASKLAAEAVVAAWSRSYGLSALSVRYFNVFGPRQPAGSAYAAVVPAFVEAYLHSKPPVIYGDGSASRDFTPVANVVAA
ncbi:MAG: NAD-dependent epimerase/dehydratase family protein, partial [Phycisphaerales bacterium]